MPFHELSRKPWLPARDRPCNVGVFTLRSAQVRADSVLLDVKIAQIPGVFGELGQSLVAAGCQHGGVEVAVRCRESRRIVRLSWAGAAAKCSIDVGQLHLGGVEGCQLGARTFEDSGQGEMLTDLSSSGMITRHPTWGMMEMNPSDASRIAASMTGRRLTPNS